MKQFTLFLVISLSGSALTATDAFSVLDINSDNTLSKEEASSLPGLLENWRALDVNSDDCLSKTEFEAYARSSRGTAAPDTEFDNLN